MSPQVPSRFRRAVRRVWRACRVTGLLLLLAVVVGALYLNRRGLPEFAKRPLLEKLRARGLDCEMSRLRLSLHRGLVGENVRFGRAAAAGPRLTARSIEVQLDYHALLRRRLHITAVVLYQARLAWPVAGDRQPPRELVVENIRAGLRLRPGDEWVLDDFHARFAGVEFTAAGAVTNASAVRDWPWLQGQTPAGTASRRLQHLADTLDRVHFATPPELRLTLNGDARDPRSFQVRLTLNAPDADTPWGEIAGGVFTARLAPAAPDAPAHAELQLQAGAAHTPWASVEGLDFSASLLSPADATNVVSGVVTAAVTRVQTKWAEATGARFHARWLHSLTNAIPLSGQGELQAAAATSPWVSGREFRLAATLATPSNAPPADAAWAWWTNLQPFHLDWQGELSQPDAEKLSAKKIVCAGRWRAPELTVTNLHADFADGALDARAQLDVATREARFELASDFDVRKIAPLLTAAGRAWLGKYSWTAPPRLAGRGSLVLPAWTNRHPDWRAEVRPTLRLAGEVFVTNGAYLGLPVDWAHTHFTYSNLIWHLPDLEIGRPEGGLRLEHLARDDTKDFYWRIHSTVDVRAVRPLLAPDEQRGLDLVAFTQPPVIDGEVRGRGHEPDRLGFAGRVTMTNFAVRGEAASYVETAVRYTNRWLEFLDPRLRRGPQTLSASGIAVDFNAQRIYFTNGFSTAEPLVVARAIGPKIGRTLEPYVFPRPPRVRVNGYAPLHGSRDADLRFDVDGAGAGFEWWKFKLAGLSGEARWLGDTLTLTNVRAAFYQGDAGGFAHFDFTPPRGTDFSFNAGVTNASLSALLADLSPRTNQLEGTLSGRLEITRANSEDARSWTGHGRARLRDGLLWEMPIFGVLSKPLDTIMPGVANSRFTDATARFTITNGVVAWDKLEMRSPAMRLQYDGTVDFDGRVDMRVEAEPLRDAWVVGRIVSLALWPVSKLFQFKITGTLDNPKSEPVFVPKFLFMPLHPFRTLEDLFAPDAKETNAPPVFKELP
jgi:hypothetical protein